MPAAALSYHAKKVIILTVWLQKIRSHHAHAAIYLIHPEHFIPGEGIRLQLKFGDDGFGIGIIHGTNNGKKTMEFDQFLILTSIKIVIFSSFSSDFRSKTSIF